MARAASTALCGILLAFGAARGDDVGAAVPAPTPMPPTLPAAMRSFDRVSDLIQEGETDIERWWAGQYLTGNWFGWRQRLSDLGLQVALTYTADILGNATGGVDRKVRYFHNIGLDFLFDLDRLVHIPGAHFHLAVSQRTGKSLSDEDIHNVFNVAQVCCGPYTQVVTVAWEQQLFNDRLGIRAGHLSMGDDFATSPLYWQYVTSGIDGNPGSLVFNVPFTEYPDATIGVRIRGRPIEHLTMQVGVYNDDLDTNAAHGGNFAVNFSDGVMVLAEVSYHDHLGDVREALPGHLTIGGFYHTGRFRRLDAPAGSTLPSDTEYGNGGIYGAIDQMVWRFADAPDPRGVLPFVSLVGAPNADVSTFPFFFNSGVVVRGPLPSRPYDDVLFGLLYGEFSNVLRQGQRAAGEPLQHFEMVLELSYILQLTPWLQLQPDIQYVIEPGGTGDIPNALVLGAQIAINI
ncbi:carbohydrate porin [bacterium]|nr:carbohydrate porin [bacterium]